MLAAGSAAPSFQLADMKGGTASSRELLAGGPAVFFFFKVSCPVCQMSAPFMQRLSGGGLQVIGISQDDVESTAEFNRHAGVSFRVLLDESRERYPVSNAYGISSVPSLFLVEPDGTISTSFSGFSKQDFEALGQRAGAVPFRPDERVPAFRAG